MSALLLTAMPLASAAAEDTGGSFLVEPGIGLMVWTLAIFLVAMLVLWKLAFPPISEALEKRQRMIEDSIDHAAKMRADADEVLAEYRERLKEARAQADEIVARATKSGAEVERLALEDSKQTREELLEQTRKDIQAETQKAIQDLRREVANLTVAAAEHVTRKSLTAEDQERLVEEALSELDFEALGARN